MKGDHLYGLDPSVWKYDFEGRNPYNATVKNLTKIQKIMVGSS